MVVFCLEKTSVGDENMGKNAKKTHFLAYFPMFPITAVIFKNKLLYKHLCTT